MSAGFSSMPHNGLQLQKVGIPIAIGIKATAAEDPPPLLMAIGIDTKHDLSRHIGKASFNPDSSGNRRFIVGAVICSAFFSVKPV